MLKSAFALALVFVAQSAHGQTPDQMPVKSLATLNFLIGTWEAKTQAPPAGADASGTYSFRKELGGHILARHSSSDACKGPATFDCDHHDLLYIYQDGPEQDLQAIYFDNEGHVIHYEVLSSSPQQVTFVTSASTPGPRFRLTYDLHNGVMSGKFQMQPPGQTSWNSYLEWSGKLKY